MSVVPCTDIKQLYFLLSDLETFNEDDEEIRGFFEKRFISVGDLRTDLPTYFEALTAWLDDELAMKPQNKPKTAAQIRQEEFEKQFARDMAAATQT